MMKHHREISLSDKQLKNLEDIAKEEKVERADAIIDIFELGIQEWKLRRALRLYREGKTTLGRLRRLLN